MTKWQESCITALASSPMAWEAFKMKQRNKRLLWQYINRIWPYKKVEESDTLSIKNGKKPITYRYNWLNIGIEIEYYATKDTPNIIGKRALRQNCVEYDFGYDGDMYTRLRENRLRLNGIKGLKGLHTLLSYMKDNCSIDTNSSLHIHVDCKYDKSYYKVCGSAFRVKKIRSVKDQWLLTSEAQKILNIIFDIETLDCWCYSRQIRHSSKFYTLEFRFGIPNFNYSDYVIQILTVIHWTECLKHNATTLNIKYLDMLSRIIVELRNNRKQLPMVILKDVMPILEWARN